MKNKNFKQKPLPVKKTIKAVAKKKGDSGIGYYFIIPILILLTVIAFFPSLSNGFTNWDDPTYILYNPLIKQLSMENTKRIFSEIYFSNYQPLHLFSYMIEYHFFQLNASGYHWVSLIMHVINVSLVWWIARFISKNNPIAFFTALLFAVTPMRVESVAWAAERKDLLYAMFFFASLICYLLYQQNKFKGRAIILSFLFFLLAVFSKAMAVSLVPVLFLTDYFYNRKFNFKNILDKIPFIIVALIMGLVSVKASKGSDSFDTSNTYSFLDRIFFACQNLLMYAGKLIFPTGLTSYYRYPDLTNGHIPMSYYASGIVVIVLAVLVFLSMKKGKLIFFSTGFFVSTVALVLMLLPVGPTIFSERYSYVPSVMLYFTLLFYLFKWVENQKSKTWMMATSVALIVCSLFFTQLTRQRCEVWKSSMTLWSDVIKKDPENPWAYNNRANEFKLPEEVNAAISDFTQAIRFNPELAEAYAGLCSAYRSIARYDSALYYVDRALAIKPGYAQGYNNRGTVRAMNNQPDSARSDFTRAIQLNPNMLEAFTNRGNLNGSLGKFDDAIQDFSMAIKLNPDFADPYKNRGILLKLKNNFDDAITNLNLYFQKGGKDPKAYLMLGQCYAGKNDFSNAVRYGQQSRDGGIKEADQFIAKWSNQTK